MRKIFRVEKNETVYGTSQIKWTVVLNKTFDCLGGAEAACGTDLLKSLV